MMVAFLADECFSGPLLRALRNAGYDVVRSADSIPAAPEEDVLALACALDRVLLTEDVDFGDLVVRFGHPTKGVIRVDLKSLDPAGQAQRLVAAIAMLDERTVGALTTIEPTRTRVRTLTSTSIPN